MKTFLSVNLIKLIEAIPVPLIIIDKDKVIRLVNKAALSLFNYSHPFLMGKTIEALLPEREHEVFSTYYSQYLKQPNNDLFTTYRKLTGITKNQTEFPLAMYCGSAIEQHHLTLITVKDLSQQVALDSKNEELEQANHAKNEFLSTMNHQLRTPLNAVLGFSELLLLKLTGSLSSVQEQQIGIIHKSGKQLLTLISDLSELAKIDSGDVTYSLQQLNANELILEVMRSLGPLAAEKNLDFTSNLGKNDILVYSDKQLLMQILTHVVSNALKFTEQGQVLLELVEDKDHVFVHVIDTGVGIKEEKIKCLFHAFQQLTIAEKKSEGSGLGLHISKKLADLINVQLEVFSQYGKGTHFIIIIPKVV